MSDSDLDDELFAIAGGTALPTGKKRKAARAVDSDSDEDDAPAAAKKAGARGKKGVPLKKRRAAEDSDEEEEDDDFEDGEAEDSSDVDDDDDDDDGLDGGRRLRDDLFYDDEDKAAVMALPEMEREEIMYERTQKLENERRRREVMAAAAATVGVGGKKAGRRQPVRSKSTSDAKAKALSRAASKKAEREAKSAERKAAHEAAAARKRSVRLDEDDDDDDDDDDDSRDDDETMHRRGDGPDANYHEVSQICVPRHKLEKWHNMPFFETTMEGCFVRIVAGEERGETVYRLCEVLAVLVGTYKTATLRPYEFPQGGSKKTPKWLLLRYGNREFVLRMAMVSNSPPKDVEFDTWAQRVRQDRKRLVPRSMVEETQEQLQAAETYKYTEEDVAKIVAEKKPKNLVTERERWKIKYEAAVNEGDEERAKEAEERLKEIETQLAKPKHEQSLFTLMGDLNTKHMRANHVIKTGDQKRAEEQTAAEDKQLDPFSRRPTRPTNYWSTKAAAQAAAEKERLAKEAEAREAGEKAAREARNKMAQEDMDFLPKTPRDGQTDLDSSHSVFVDIDLSRSTGHDGRPYSLKDAIANQASLFVPQKRKPSGPRVGGGDELPPGIKLMSLSEYWERHQTNNA